MGGGIFFWDYLVKYISSHGIILRLYIKILVFCEVPILKFYYLCFVQLARWICQKIRYNNYGLNSSWFCPTSPLESHTSFPNQFILFIPCPTVRRHYATINTVNCNTRWPSYRPFDLLFVGQSFEKKSLLMN